MILLLLAGFLVYSPVLKARFVYDDFWMVVRNPALRSFHPIQFLLNNQTVADPSSGLASDIFRPMVTASYALDYHLWRLQPLPYHLENLLLFLGNAWLLGCLLQRLLKNRGAALVGTAVFLFHPVQVQTVAWIAQRSSLLSGLGILGALLCWTGDPPPSAPSRWSGWMLYGMALASKETAILLPAILFLLDGKRGKRRWVFYSALFGTTLLYLVLRSHVLHQWSQFGQESLGERTDWRLGAMAFPMYLGKLIVPTGLRPSYGYPSWNGVWIAGGLALMAAYGGTVFFLLRRHWLPGIALAWIGIGLLPFLQLIPIRAFFADRFLYISLMGLALAVGWGVASFPRIQGLIGLWIVCLLGLTIQTIPHWKTEERLWAYGIRQEPTNAFAHVCYAEAVGDWKEAEKHYRLALVNHPAEGIRFAAVNNLAAGYLQHNERGKALYWAREAVRLQPSDPHALYNLRRALLR